MNKHIVAFFKKGVINHKNVFDNSKIVMTIQAELMNIGYMLTYDAYMLLSSWSSNELKEFASIIPYINEMIGNDANYKPLYAGFPLSIIQMSNEEIKWKQYLAYWGILPKDEDTSKYVLENVSYKEIGVIQDFENIFTKIASLNTGLAPIDNKIFEWFLNRGNLQLPETIPFKETLCRIAKHGYNVPVKTSTDVLRIAKYINHGGLDFVIPKKFIRGQRNEEWSKTLWKEISNHGEYIMSLLDKVANPSEMILKRMHWVTLSKAIKFWEYPQYSRATEALKIMCQKYGYPKSWYGHVEKAFKISPKKGILKRAERPGEFARRLDDMMRNYPEEQSFILKTFAKIASNISNKVLFELWTYMESRGKNQNSRQVWTGEKKKPTNLPLLKAVTWNEQVIDTIWSVLGDKFSQLEDLGECWIDPRLKKIPLPTNMKSLEESMDVVIRGSRNPFMDKTKRYVSIYCSWKGSRDYDLRVFSLYNDGKIGSYGFGGYVRNSTGTIIHSGDNTGNYTYNSEIVSVDMEKANAKYLLATLNLFSGVINSDDLKVGFMERDDVFVSKSWKPDQVSHTMKFNCVGKVNLFIIDVEKREWILVDELLDNKSVASKDELSRYLDRLSEKPNFSVYDLLKLHVENRGHLTEKIKTETTKFAFEDFSKDYTETLKWML